MEQLHSGANNGSKRTNFNLRVSDLMNRGKVISVHKRVQLLIVSGVCFRWVMSLVGLEGHLSAFHMMVWWSEVPTGGRFTGISYLLLCYTSGVKIGLHQSDESGIRLVPICVPNNEICSMLVIAFNVAKVTIKILCDKCVCKIMEPKFNHLEWRF